MSLTSRLNELIAWYQAEAENQRHALTTARDEGVAVQASRRAAMNIYQTEARRLAVILTEAVPITVPKRGSIRPGGHNPCNLWLDPDRNRATAKQVATMVTKEIAAQLARSMNMFPAATFVSGPAHRGDRHIYLNGGYVGTAVDAEWAQAAVDAMNAHYQSERLIDRLEADSGQSVASDGEALATSQDDQVSDTADRG